MLSGRYDLQTIIGQGGTAEVWRAVDRRLDRVVAVKVLRSDLATDRTFPERLRREARAIAGLDHPGIVEVYDAGSDERDGIELPYVVMEYVEGLSLRDLIAAGERLTPEHAMRVVADVLDALECSHRAGIVHRDIKPGNVMLTDADTVKVMDFGIARAVAGPAAELTATSEVIGTAQYLSPEQALGSSVDGRSDVYSTGCLLYELLTGRPPFVGSSPVSVAYMHVREPVSSPLAVDPSLPPHYASVVLRALAKDPSERYPSAAAMRADVEAALVGPASPARRAPTYALAAVGVALAVVGAAAYLVAEWPGPDAGTVRQPEVAPAPSRSAPAQVGEVRSPGPRSSSSPSSPSSSGEPGGVSTPDSVASPGPTPSRPEPGPTASLPAPEPSASESESESPGPSPEPTESDEPSPEPSSEPSSESSPEPSPDPQDESEPSPSPPADVMLRTL